MPLRSSLLLLCGCLCSSHASSADRTIYRCIDAGVVAFSDRPCGGSIEIYSADRPISSTAVAATAGKVVPEAPASLPDVAVPAGRDDSMVQDDVHTAACARVEAELRRLAARLRGGYGVAEGERVRARYRNARERRRKLRCR